MQRRQIDILGYSRSAIPVVLLLLSVPTPSRAQAPAAPAQGDEMGQMPDIGIPWPDLGADEPVLKPLEPEIAPPNGSAAPGLEPLVPQVETEDTQEAERLAAIDPSQPLRYSVSLEGIDTIRDSVFDTRFDALSELKKGAGAEANLAQIARRAKADVQLVDSLLRNRGYYDARISYRFHPGEEARQKLRVALVVEPGPLYLLDVITVTGLDLAMPREAHIRSLFTVKRNDPADTDKILASTDAVRTGLAEGGYPFAKVDEPVLRVDHDKRDADLDLIIATGGYRRFGHITVTGNPPFNARHVADIARFHPGDPYKASEVSDLNHALIATSLVATTDIKTVEGKEPGTVDLNIAMTRAPARTIAGEVGYGTGQGASVEVSWQHRNLFPPEGSLTLRGLLGTQEQGVSATYRRSNFKKRDQALNAQLSFNNLDQAAYHARTASITANLERQTNLFFQKKWTWSVGGELTLSDERDLYGVPPIPRDRTYFIAALPMSLAYDGSDDLLDPKKGFRLSGRVSPELSLQAGTFGYVRAQVDGSGYFPASERLTLAGRVRLGTIVGASSDRIAPTRRFYSGGGGSVRGYSYQAIGPRDANNDPVGGRSLAEFSLEGRIRFGSHNQFGVVPFVDAGTISPDAWPSLQEMRVGAGLGVRYYSSFGPIRVDVATPINPQPGDPPIGVYVSLGQAF
jgi:translocation and assembly module TamA